MKVAKFGGSSLSSAGQIMKVAQIIQNDPEIRYVVVSAPGKRHDKDIKVTDLLIALYTNHSVGLDTSAVMNEIIDRFRSIALDLQIGEDIISEIQVQLNNILAEVTEAPRLLDVLKSCGEDFNAQLISRYLKQIGLAARYCSPLELGIRVTDEPSNAKLLPESYDLIANFKDSEDILVIPGFFGYSLNQEIVTFSRGGSDITGAIIARGVQADVYENYTDQSYIYSANPNVVKNPHAIKELTYREMRELAYSGFGIFHDEALAPLYEVQIPVQIKNTNLPEITGTRIVNDRDTISSYPVIGVSGDAGFLSVTMKRYLLNREIGFLRRVLQVFEDHNISIEHAPTGIDDISILVRESQFSNNHILDDIISDIKQQFDPEWVHVEKDLGMVAVVGEGMRDTIGLANKATQAFTESKISLQMINQGASEISMFFAIPAKDLNKAVNALYQNFF